MKVLYQFASLNPTGWQTIDARDWALLPKLPTPVGLGGQNNIPGLVRNVSVQGITCEGYDHVAIEPITIGNEEGVKLTVWNDDPDDFLVGERNAVVWTILPLGPDPKLGMAINTRQSCVRYCEGARFDRFLLTHPPQNTTIRPWTEFIVPSESVTRHGVWLDNAKHQEHIVLAPQAEYGWRHWTEHLPDSELEVDSKGRRKLKTQRDSGRYHQAERTITYYQRDTARAVGVGTFTYENALETITATAATQSLTTDASHISSWIFSTPANEPNSADWPSGQYHSQLDCTAASAGLVYGIGSTPASVHDRGFNRVSSDLTSALDNALITSGNGDADDFSGTGLKLTTSDTSDRPAGSAGDRFSVAVHADGDSTGDAITLELNTADSYADGPWVPPILQILTENLTITDTKTNVTMKPLTETPTLSDAVSKGLLRGLLESTSITDAKINAPTKVLADTLLANDLITKTPLKNLTEAPTIFDTIEKVTTRILTDTASLSDILVVLRTKELIETLSISDNLSRLITQIRQETLILVDILVKSSIRTLVETVTSSDILILLRTKELSENLSITDAIEKLNLKTLLESTGISDSVLRTALKPLPESVNVADTLSRVLVRELLETTPISDVITKFLLRQLPETITITELFAAILARILVEAITVTDIREMVQIRNLLETITVTDIKQFHTLKILLETITPTENVIKELIAAVFTDTATVNAARRTKVVDAARRIALVVGATRATLFQGRRRREERMIIYDTEKQTSEKRPLGIEWNTVLQVGETISLSGTTITSKNEASGADSSATILNGSQTIAGTQQSIGVHQGGNLENHLIEYHIKTSLGNEYEDEIRLRIRNY